MKFEQYAPLALRTAKPLERNAQIEHAQIGILTETGELADAFKRHVIYGKPLDVINLAEEVGDVLWYVALLLNELGVKARVIDRLIEDMLEEQDDPTVSDLRLVLTIGAMAGAIASHPDGGVPLAEGCSLLIGLLVLLLKRHGQTIYTSMDANIKKLHDKEKGRYKDGVFSTEAALNRDVDVERETLNEAIGA
jgi:NTP pyrophosphatase (non-canonical NTP hydrolase)